MSVPKYSEMYKAFLNCLIDGHIHQFKQIKEDVAKTMDLSAEDRQMMLPSGKQTLFDNRLHWTSTYLKKAGLIGSPARATFLLTSAGKEVVANMPQQLDDRFLMKFPSFREFISYSRNAISEPENTLEDTPQDVFDKAFAQMNASLSDELLAEIIKQPPVFFEHLVVILLQKMGYGGSVQDSGIVTGQSGDEGIDGIVKEDKLGFNLIYIQAKRWELDKIIGRPEIQKFVGALAGLGAQKGLFITTAAFSKDALTYASKQHTTKVILVDGKELARLMIDHDLGVSVEVTYKVKKIDTDFFNAD